MTQLFTYQKPVGLLCLGMLMLLLFDSCLVAVLFTGPQSADAGELISTQLRIKSDSNIEQGQPIAAHIYVSTDPTLDTEDRKLSTAISYSELQTDGYLDFIHNFTIPANLASGQYYLLAVVSQNDENNPAQTRIYDNGQNIFQHSIKINGQVDNRSDLLLSNVRIGGFGDNYYELGTYYPIANPNFTLTVENRGEIASGAVSLQWYYSFDTYFSTSEDVFGGTKNVPAIPAQNRAELTGNLDLDDAYLNTYNYIFFVLDQENTEPEWNNSNNEVYRRILVREFRPDHRISNLNTPGLAQAGTPVNLSGQVEGLSSTSSAVGIYLSTDKSLSNDDQLLSSFTANANGPFSRIVNLPANISTGSYYLLANVNDLQTVTETDYSNNYDDIRLFIIGNNFTDDICEEVIVGLEGENNADVATEEKRGLSEEAIARLHPFELSLYPNPTTERITAEMTIDKEAQPFQIQLLDLSGKALHQIQITDPEPGQYKKSMDVSRLPAGSYILRVSDGKSVQTKQFVVK